MNSFLEKKDFGEKEIGLFNSVLKLCQTSVQCADCGIFLFEKKKQKLSPFTILKDSSKLKEKLDKSLNHKVLKKISQNRQDAPQSSKKKVWVEKDLNFIPLFFEDEFFGLFVCFFEDSKKRDAKNKSDLIFPFANILLSLFENFVQKRSQEKLKMTNQNLLMLPQILLDQLNKLNRFETFSELADIIAHDINNPLQIILGKTQILLMKKQREDDKKNLEELRVIEKSANRISSLAKELSLFVKQIKSQVEPSEGYKAVDVDISQILNRTFSLLKNRFKSKGIELDLKIEKGLPKVKGVPHKLENIFLSLLLRAEDAISQKGKLNIWAKKRGRFIQLDFKDTAEKIPEDILPKVFDPFLILPQLNRRVGSSLFFVSEVVKEHRGTIEVKSGEDGNTFIVKLPIIEGGC